MLNAPLDELMQQFEVLHLDVMAQASELNTLSAEDEDKDGETEMFSDSVMESVEQGKISLLLADDAIVAANSVSWLQAIPADGDNKPEDGVWGHMDDTMSATLADQGLGLDSHCLDTWRGGKYEVSVGNVGEKEVFLPKGMPVGEFVRCTDSPVSLHSSDVEKGGMGDNGFESSNLDVYAVCSFCVGLLWELWVFGTEKLHVAWGWLL